MDTGSQNCTGYTTHTEYQDCIVLSETSEEKHVLSMGMLRVTRKEEVGEMQECCTDFSPFNSPNPAD